MRKGMTGHDDADADADADADDLLLLLQMSDSHHWPCSLWSRKDQKKNKETKNKK